MPQKAGRESRKKGKEGIYLHWAFKPHPPHRWGQQPRSPCRYAGRSDAGCLYELCVKLLSENEDVLAEYKSETITIPQDNDASWTEVSYSCGLSR